MIIYNGYMIVLVWGIGFFPYTFSGIERFFGTF